MFYELYEELSLQKNKDLKQSKKKDRKAEESSTISNSSVD